MGSARGRSAAREEQAGERGGRCGWVSRAAARWSSNTPSAPSSGTLGAGIVGCSSPSLTRAWFSL
eukprot:1018710-Rhodomonas_salina.1